jgi:hypothetical protein
MELEHEGNILEEEPSGCRSPFPEQSEDVGDETGVASIDTCSPSCLAQILTGKSGGENFCSR